MFKLRSLLLAVVLLLVVAVPAFAQTQGSNDPPPVTSGQTNLSGEVGTAGTSRSAEDNPNGFNFTEEEIDAYNEAVRDCTAPSLECLVRYTTRFVAIEWVNDINGKPSTFGPEGSATTDAGSTGAVSSLFGLMGNMYEHRPAQTSTYIADVLNTAGVAQPAYAQGLGFASLDPVLDLWKVFRNVAYFFFIVVFLIIGFMIMLRQKINGQVVVTAQQAIPSVIISLILVTFSYAIAGFMIDMMYVLMFLLIGLFGQIGGIPIGGGNEIAADQIITFNILDLIGFFWNTGAIAGFGENITLVKQIFDSAGATGALGELGGILGGLTLTIIISVAVLIGTIRLFFELLKSYAAIVLYVVSAPLTLMFGAIPGRNVFWPWFKALVGNLLTFPVVLLILILYIEFTKSGTGTFTASDNSVGFMPPFLFGNSSTTSGAPSMIGPLLGLALILALPEVVKELKKTMGASELGFGGKLMGWAGDAAKGFGTANWKEVPAPFRSVVGGTLKGVAATPTGIIGGVAGYKYGQSKVRELGLEGNTARIAKYGGLIAGLGVGAKAPGTAIKAGKGLAMQYAQSQGSRFIEEAEEAARSRRKAANQLSGQQALAKEAEAQKATAEAHAKAQNPEELAEATKKGHDSNSAATRGLADL